MQVQGTSLPAYQRNCFQDCGDVDGIISFGDGVIDLDEYLTLLATEYRLLLDANQDVTATANKLYYALYAVQRLNDFVERYFDPLLSTGSANGFFVRDDWPADMFKQMTANEEDRNGILLMDPLTDFHSIDENLITFQIAHREEGPIPSNDYRAEDVVKVTYPVDPTRADPVFLQDRSSLVSACNWLVVDQKKAPFNTMNRAFKYCK
jgi:hypothetical protein